MSTFMVAMKHHWNAYVWHCISYRIIASIETIWPLFLSFIRFLFHRILWFFILDRRRNKHKQFFVSAMHRSFGCLLAFEDENPTWTFYNTTLCDLFIGQRLVLHSNCTSSTSRMRTVMLQHVNDEMHFFFTDRFKCTQGVIRRIQCNYQIDGLENKLLFFF